MRVIALLLAGGLLASCTTAPEATYRAADSQLELDKLLAGKVAQKPVSCLPHWSSKDMRVIDDATIAYRDGGHRTYVTHMYGVCSNLSSASAALVTKLVGSVDVCQGDIAHVVDTSTGMTIGSCSYGDFTPYVTAER
jgi:Family of unknown function (DUF6491)